MNARSKLNGIYIGGSLVMAAVLGIVLQSWVVFLISAVLLIGAAAQSEQIRF